MDARKSKTITFKLSSEVHEKWKKQASDKGLSFSDFIRSCVDEKQVTGISPPFKKDRNRAFSKADPELIFQVAQIGNNVNQIARWLNKSGGEIESIKLMTYLSVIKRDVENLLSGDQNVS